MIAIRLFPQIVQPQKIAGIVTQTNGSTYFCACISCISVQRLSSKFKLKLSKGNVKLKSQSFLSIMYVVSNGMLQGRSHWIPLTFFHQTTNLTLTVWNYICLLYMYLCYWCLFQVHRRRKREETTRQSALPDFTAAQGSLSTESEALHFSPQTAAGDLYRKASLVQLFLCNTSIEPWIASSRTISHCRLEPGVC